MFTCSTRVQDRGRADDIPVVCVSGRTTARFYLHRDTELIVEGVDLIVDRWSPVLAEQNWPVNLGLLRLAALHGITQRHQARA